jgi:hypothetical protein
MKLSYQPKVIPNISECAITVIDYNFNNDSRCFGIVALLTVTEFTHLPR